MNTAIDLPQAIIPGLNALLGLPCRKTTETAEETWEALCARISRGKPAPFRVYVAADGQVREVTP